VKKKEEKIDFSTKIRKYIDMQEEIVGIRQPLSAEDSIP
jgi:hypothetical protein